VPALPEVGTRVALRYRRPVGAQPPLTDVIGHLLEVSPRVRVRTKTGDVVDIATEDVVAVRRLTDQPVRTSQIRATEHAAALAWPGREQRWLNGWLLRAADGHTNRANSAVPLGIRAGVDALPAIADWYERRGLPALLAVPDRLLPVPDDLEADPVSLVMTRALDDTGSEAPDDALTLADRPDPVWLRRYRREVPVDVLTAVVDGDVVFGMLADAAVGRAAVTQAPDGSRWVGLSAVRVADDQRRRGHARRLCAGLLDWGSRRGATHAYIQVLTDNAAAIRLYESMGFTLQHRQRYVRADQLNPRRV
jgi:N-acetylglutamate synthase